MNEADDNLKNGIKTSTIVLLICIVIALIILFPKFYKGSNADITQEPDAVLKCYWAEYNQTTTFEYSYLNESDSLNAYKFAELNNCTFHHSRLKINLTEENNGK
jgi:hypothetical protein